VTAVFFITANADTAIWEYRYGWVVVAALVGDRRRLVRVALRSTAEQRDRVALLPVAVSCRCG